MNSQDTAYLSTPGWKKATVNSRLGCMRGDCAVMVNDHVNDLQGKIGAGDAAVVEVSREELPDHKPRIMVRPRYQTRLTSSSITRMLIAVN